MMYVGAYTRSKDIELSGKVAPDMRRLRFYGRVFTSGVAVEEFALDVVEAYAHLLKENEVVIHEVAGLIDEAVAVAVDSFDGRLNSLFAHFLSYLLDTLYEETCGVGVLGHLGVAAGNQGGE